MVRIYLRRLRPSPSMAVAFLALVVALGGTSYAVTRLPANSVGSKQLKAGAVARVDIKKDAVNGAKVGKDSLTGDDINEASLAQVSSAVTAGSAGSAAHANSTGVLDKISFRIDTKSVPAAASDGTPGAAIATAACDGGQIIAGGGVKVEDIDNTSVIDSYPDAGGRAWSAHVDNNDASSPHNFTAYAICIPALAAG
jgi:hypothetical protein